MKHETQIIESALTAQELFTQIARHLLTQNEQSYSGMFCAYRGDDGLKCAVGAVLLDEEFISAEMEGCDVAALSARGFLPERLRPHATLLQCLQAVHDKGEPVSWSGNLQYVAERFGLRWEL